MVSLMLYFLKLRKSLTKRVIIILILLWFSCLKWIIVTFIETASFISKSSKHIVFISVFSLAYIKWIKIERILSFCLLNWIAMHLLIFGIKGIKFLRIWVFRKKTIFLLEATVCISFPKRLFQTWFLFKLILWFLPAI